MPRNSSVDAAAPAPTQPAGAEDTIRVRVRQQEPAGEHDLSLPIDVRPSRRSPRVRRARLPHLSSRVVVVLLFVKRLFFFYPVNDATRDATTDECFRSPSETRRPLVHPVTKYEIIRLPSRQ